MTVEMDATRKELLREFFLNATLIALINELGRESARLRRALEDAGEDPAALLESIPVPAA